MQTPETNAVWAILAAALATYGLRAGGLFLAARLPKNPRLLRGMQALPGALLLSLVVPSVIAAGIWGFIAASAAAVFAIRTRNLMGAMLVGVGIMLLHRRMGM